MSSDDDFNDLLIPYFKDLVAQCIEDSRRTVIYSVHVGRARRCCKCGRLPGRVPAAPQNYLEQIWASSMVSPQDRMHVPVVSYPPIPYGIGCMPDKVEVMYDFLMTRLAQEGIPAIHKDTVLRYSVEYGDDMTPCVRASEVDKVLRQGLNAYWDKALDRLNAAKAPVDGLRPALKIMSEAIVGPSPNIEDPCLLSFGKHRVATLHSFLTHMVLHASFIATDLPSRAFAPYSDVRMPDGIFHDITLLALNVLHEDCFVTPFLAQGAYIIAQTGGPAKGCVNVLTLFHLAKLPTTPYTVGRGVSPVGMMNLEAGYTIGGLAKDGPQKRAADFWIRSGGVMPREFAGPDGAVGDQMSFPCEITPCPHTGKPIPGPSELMDSPVRAEQVSDTLPSIGIPVNQLLLEVRTRTRLDHVVDCQTPAYTVPSFVHLYNGDIAKALETLDEPNKSTKQSATEIMSPPNISKVFYRLSEDKKKVQTVLDPVQLGFFGAHAYQSAFFMHRYLMKVMGEALRDEYPDPCAVAWAIHNCSFVARHAGAYLVSMEHTLIEDYHGTFNMLLCDMNFLNKLANVLPKATDDMRDMTGRLLRLWWKSRYGPPSPTALATRTTWFATLVAYEMCALDDKAMFRNRTGFEKEKGYRNMIRMISDEASATCVDDPRTGLVASILSMGALDCDYDAPFDESTRGDAAAPMARCHFYAFLHEYKYTLLTMRAHNRSMNDLAVKCIAKRLSAVYFVNESTAPRCAALCARIDSVYMYCPDPKRPLEEFAVIAYATILEPEVDDTEHKFWYSDNCRFRVVDAKTAADPLEMHKEIVRKIRDKFDADEAARDVDAAAQSSSPSRSPKTRNKLTPEEREEKRRQAEEKRAAQRAEEEETKRKAKEEEAAAKNLRRQMEMKRRMQLAASAGEVQPVRLMKGGGEEEERESPVASEAAAEFGAKHVARTETRKARRKRRGAAKNARLSAFAQLTKAGEAEQRVLDMRFGDLAVDSAEDPGGDEEECFFCSEPADGMKMTRHGRTFYCPGCIDKLEHFYGQPSA